MDGILAVRIEPNVYGAFLPSMIGSVSVSGLMHSLMSDSWIMLTHFVIMASSVL
jgi:hypothetical protein